MEAWVIACIVFVFAALMEYTGILLQVLSGGYDTVETNPEKIGKLSLKIRIVEPQKTVPGGKITFYNYDVTWDHLECHYHHRPGSHQASLRSITDGW